jgi:hypothetical protein
MNKTNTMNTMNTMDKTNHPILRRPPGDGDGATTA